MRIFAASWVLRWSCCSIGCGSRTRECARYARLAGSIDAQTSANREQAERNRQLAAEVTDLKVGLPRSKSAPAANSAWSATAKPFTKS